MLIALVLCGYHHTRQRDDTYDFVCHVLCDEIGERVLWRGGGLGSRPKNMYGETLGDGVEYHLMSLV